MSIELTNPRGQKKLMSTTEYLELLPRYFKSKAFAEWSNRRNIAGEIKIGNEIKISVSALELFLKDSGYKIEMVNK